MAVFLSALLISEKSTPGGNFPGSSSAFGKDGPSFRPGSSPDPGLTHPLPGCPESAPDRTWCRYRSKGRTCSAPEGSRQRVSVGPLSILPAGESLWQSHCRESHGGTPLAPTSILLPTRAFTFFRGRLRPRKGK